MSYPLPFKRGEVWPSGDQGAVPTNILGKTLLDPTDGTLLRIVKNTHSAVLEGCIAVKWEDADAYEVDKAAASGAVTVAGIVDPTYANLGKTVPVNAACWVVQKGPTHCIAGAVVASGASIVTDAGASNGVQGRIQNGALASNPAGVYGITYASANAGASVFCMVNIP